MVLALELDMRDVLFLNWPIDPGIVADHLPESLSVDTHDGRAWLSAVALTNVDVRPRGLPRAVGVDLPEVNLQTRVTREGTAGIYYFGVEVAGLLGTVFPRLFHHAPYHYATIERRPSTTGARITCRRRHPGSRPVRLDAEYAPIEEPVDAAPGSLARFLTDRHRFFTESPDETLWTATIRHAPWPLYRAGVTVDRNTLLRGNGFGDPPGERICLYSPGVEATMSRCVPWRRVATPG